MSEETIKQYAIYEDPDDYPGKFVVREWLISAGQANPGNVQVFESLEEAHSALPAGASKIEIQDPDPKIIEVWM